jgi:hypothetical protein
VWLGDGDSATLRDAVGVEVSFCTWSADDVVDGLVLCPIATAGALGDDGNGGAATP